MTNVPELLTVKVVAAEVFGGRISTQRIYELLRTGILPSVRLGRQIFIPVDALAAFVAAGGKGLDTQAAPAATKRRASA